MIESQRQLTLRAILTGFVIGSLLAPCNIYTGLKIGFSFNMSITAALLSYAFWNGLHRARLAKHWGLLENNINQTTASSAASILSAGLVAPIPALTLITGQTLSYPVLVLWVFVVSFTGIVCAVAIRRQMLDREKLPFPNGIATAETISEIYAQGADAAKRVRWLLGAALLSGGIKLYGAFIASLPSLKAPAEWGFRYSANGVENKVSWRNLGLELQPSLLLVGFGAIVGPRVGTSLLLGTLIGWILLPPELLSRQWASPAETLGGWYENLLEWLLWPGVSLMVTAALTSFAISLGRIWRSKNTTSESHTEGSPQVDARFQFPRNQFIGGALLAVVLVVAAQYLIFEIPLWLGVVSFLMSFILAIVAGRVSGETGIPPIGALGKITQVSFGFLAPANSTINLMTANVTGGAAGQCSDLLHDLKTGKLIGASLQSQIYAQCFGILAGSLAGCAAYLILVPDPQAMLLTPEWPAPAVATWKAVAEVLGEGLNTIPESTRNAAYITGLIGIALAFAEAFLPAKARHWVPSASSVGFALIIPPFISIAMFLGAMIRVMLDRVASKWSHKYTIVIAAGLVAGESIGGVLHAITQFLF